jgi:flagellar hook-basal body complex protein FliE
MDLPSVGNLTPLAPLTRPTGATSETSPAGGFGQVLGSLLAENQRANAAADAAVAALVTGEAQDLHTVSAAVAQADLSFRLILELRNRLTEAFQEVSRMQV